MSRKIRKFAVLSAVLSVAILVSSIIYYYNFLITAENNSPEKADRIFTLRMKVTYENKNNGTTVWNLTDDDRILGLFLNNSWQTVYLANCSHSVDRLTDDKDGNTVAYLSLKKQTIMPNETITFEASYRILYRLRSVPDISEGKSAIVMDIPEDLKDLYCRPTGPWRESALELHRIATQITDGQSNVLSILNKLVVWIAENISYGSSEGPRYPNETLYEMTGDCDDQANLLIAFCRAIGIPAYLQVGCIYLPFRQEANTIWDGHLHNKLNWIGWHGWAMVYVPPWQWLPVDLTYIDGNLSMEPTKAITTSAIIKHPTIQYANIKETDYIHESRKTRDFLISHEFFIQQEDNMNEEIQQNSTPHETKIFKLELLAQTIMTRHISTPEKIKPGNSNIQQRLASMKWNTFFQNSLIL